ncbi:MAG: FAD-binding oxidoreductase [Pseudomonadota bacterium]
MQQLIDTLTQAVAEGRITTDETERTFFAQDVFTSDMPAGVVVAPANRQELAAVVKAATDAGHAVVTRGGGMSYTSGYVPREEGSVMIDMARMNRLIELNREDMYVKVEAGMSWKDLHEALDGSGLSTPYWGTLSGLHATVGGGMSQNSIFWGSGRHGTAADSVIGLEVVLADGTVVTTGAASQINARPFFRHFGPDLTGLFTGDCGAFGVKATVTLRLVPVLPGKAFGSWAFEDHAPMARAMSEISRRGLVTECFGFDPYLQQQRMRRESLAKDATQFMGMLKASGGLGKAVKEGVKVAAAGRRFMDDVKWSFHGLVSERDERVAREAIAECDAIVTEQGGRILPNSIPKLLFSHPFGNVNNMLGPDGERWVPVHGLVPHSRAVATIDRIEALFADHAEDMQRLEVATGYLLATIATSAFVVEPVFFWPDELFEMHRRYVEPEHLKRLPKRGPNAEARALVTKLKHDLADLFRDEGAVHLQVAKAYHYEGGLKEEPLQLARAVKAIVDPKGRMNPGALGL